MRWPWRVLTVVLVFLGVGYATARLLIAHAVAKGAPEPSVRLGGAMGGLFVGGATAVLVGLALLVLGRGSGDDVERE